MKILKKSKRGASWRRSPGYVDLDKLEIVNTELKYCGEYDPKEIKNAVLKFQDERHGKDCLIVFSDGDIWLKERRN